MFRAIFYKEWIKVRLPWVLLLVANLAFCAYLGLRLRRVDAFYDPVTIWSSWIFKGYLFFRPWQYVPLLMGVIVGGLQFLPEVLNKRVRLVLHLPLGEERAIALHLLAGWLLLTLALAPGFVVLAVASVIQFPDEFHGHLLHTAGPWLLSGYAAYLFTASALLEPCWRHRVFLVVAGLALVRLFHLDGFYDAYRPILPGLALWTAAAFALPLLSSHRFRRGLGS